MANKYIYNFSLVTSPYCCLLLGLDRLCSSPCLLFYSLIPKILAHYALQSTYYAFQLTYYMVLILAQKFYIPQHEQTTVMDSAMLNHVVFPVNAHLINLTCSSLYIIVVDGRCKVYLR